MMSDVASTSSARPLCTVCHNRYAIYTCPRCQVRTCSLPCSTQHKSATNCSGVRNKAAFVSMRDYSWGTMMNDYVYLEEISRKVGEWGHEIGKGGYANQNADRNTNGRGRDNNLRGKGDRGRDRRHGGHGPPKTKREILRTQLEIRDISMELLPIGMERRKHNQSSWDFRNQTAFLTIEFKFHPPKKYASKKHEASEAVKPATFLTHRNNVTSPLLSLIQSQVQEIVSKTEKNKGKGKGKEKETEEQSNSLFPPWLLALLQIPSNPSSSAPSAPSAPPIDGSSTEPLESPPYDALLRAPIFPLTLAISGTFQTLAYHRIEPTQPLLSALRGMHFVEYPTIEVWCRGEFTGVIVDPNSTDVTVKTDVGTELNRKRTVDKQSQNDKTYEEYIEELEREPKRQKTDLKAGKKTISGLLGGYGSDEGSEDEISLEKNSLALLDGYEESDGEAQNVGDEDSAGEGEDTDDEVEVDPKTLIELMRQAQAQDRDGWDAEGEEAEDRVDWGDGDSGEEVK